MYTTYSVAISLPPMSLKRQRTHSLTYLLAVALEMGSDFGVKSHQRGIIKLRINEGDETKWN